MATIAIDSANKLAVVTLVGGGETGANLARVQFNTSNNQVLTLRPSGQGQLVASIKPIAPGIADITVQFFDGLGNVQGAIAVPAPIHVQVTGADPQTAAVASTGTPPPAATPYPTVDPGAPQAGHEFTSGVAPALAAGAQAGGAPPAPTLAAGADDSHGNISFGTGSAPAAGAMVVVTFASPYPNVPSVSLTPMNDATQALNVEDAAVTAAGFTVAVRTAPAAAQGVGVYQVSYQVQD